MVNLTSKLRLSLIILFLISFTLILTFLGDRTGVISLNRVDSEDNLETADISLLSLPRVIIGGTDGDIYLLDQNSEVEYIGTVQDDIQDIERSENNIFVATVKDNEKDEEFGRSDGRLMKFSTNTENSISLGNLFSSPDQTAKIGGQLLDLEISENKIIAASHSHNSTSEVEGETFYEGKLSIIDREVFDTEKEIDLEGASDIKVYENSILAYGVGPKAVTLDNNHDVINEIEVEGTISGVEKQGEFYYFTLVREHVVTKVPTRPTVRHGYITKYDREGKEIATIDTGITSRPREIAAYEDEMMIVNDFAEEEIKFVDFSRNEVVDTISLEDRPEHLTVSGNKAYAIGSDEDLLYIIDLETRTLEDNIQVNGINSISSY
ncbi:hypothetical protein HRED_01244 [Candidatus Haloredivivus sp. G17]|nr:hypothetical protein HRED_01244 [Candidatus Haloredivivus sp. G17]